MTDPGYRKMVEQDFQKKKKVLEGNPGNLFAVFDSPMSVEEREALMFLYAYSPLIDLSFSGGDFLLKNVRWAFQAREAMPWGKDIPEDIFRHFVLPVRGGKENLDTARIVFYKELKERVATCESMEKAALEVNHWCHEHVIYKPTNARTRSPLATMLTAAVVKSPYSRWQLCEPWEFRHVRYTRLAGRIVMIITRGLRSGWMASGSTWGLVNRNLG